MKRKILIHKRGTHEIIGETVMEIPDGEGNLSAYPYYISDTDITPLDFESVKSELISRINVAAGNARLKFITGAPGQAETYLKKAEQARDYLANGGKTGDYLFLDAEIAALGGTLTDVAEFVLMQHDGWIVLGSKIEQIRRIAIVKLEKETEQSIVYEITEQTIQDLNGVII